MLLSPGRSFWEGQHISVSVSGLDATGSFVEAWHMGGTDWDDGAGVSVVGNTSVHTTGAFYDTVNFDPGVGSLYLSSPAKYDMFLTKQQGAPLLAAGDQGRPTGGRISCSIPDRGNPLLAADIRTVVS